MSIHLSRRFAYALISSIVILFGSANAQDFDKVEIQTMQAGEGVYMLTGAGGNIGVSVGDDGVFLIDDQFAPLNEKIKAAVARISDKPIEFVINSHWHFDHTGGNELLGGGGALIVAHENVRKRLTTEQFIEFFDKRIPPSPEIALPVVTFTDAVTFHLNGDEIEVFHVEASHTDGDAVVYFKKANVMHTGDVLFSEGYPFIDIENGGSVDGVIRVAARLLEIIDDDTKLIPGHGSLADKSKLEEYYRMLVTLRNRVKTKIDAGMSLDEIIADRPTADFDESRKGMIPPEGFVKILYDSLSR